MFDFDGGHLAVVIVVEVAVDAVLVAAVGEIKLHAERNAQPQRPVAHFLHQHAHLCLCRSSGDCASTGASGLAIGSSEISKMPCWARSLASTSASRMASSGCTSNSEQMRRLTISWSGVAPSAACQRMVAVGFSVNSVEP